MYEPSLLSLRFETEERARKALGWLVAHVDELRPAAAMTRWTHADRARVAAAECAVICQPLARLVPLEDRVYVALLADWIERLAVPELIAWSRTGAAAWYRPLVLTAGALAESGVRVHELEVAVRAYPPPSAARTGDGRPEHTIDTAYFWAKLRHTTDAPDVDVACERTIRHLLREPVNEWSARALNRAIVCQSDFGKAPEQVSPHAAELLVRTTTEMVADGNADLAAESAFARWCLGLEWSNELRPVIACLNRAQRASGAFAPHVRRAEVGVDETERCYHATLSGLLAYMALAQMLREDTVYDGSIEDANTANAAQ